MHHRIVGPLTDGAGAAQVALREHFQRVGRAPLDSALQRVMRPRGPVRKRQRPAPQALRGRLLERLNARDVMAARGLVEPRGMVGFARVMNRVLPGIDVSNPPEYAITGAALGASLAAPDTLAGIELPKRMQRTEIQYNVGSVLDGWLNLTKDAAEPGATDLDRTCEILKGALHPRTTVAARVAARLDLDGVARNGDPLQRIMAAPEFPQPMYEALRDKAQELVLPGIEKVPQNTIGVLETNRRFVEAYLCGCNHALAAELLWREYPTDQRGSYFRQFWDVAGFIPSSAQLTAWRAEVEAEVPVGAENRDGVIAERLAAKIDGKLKDIPPIHGWGSGRLGENTNPLAADLPAGLVLIVRGDLFKKYPNTVVYAVKARPLNGKRYPDLPEYFEATGTQSEPVFPLFSGSLPPDTNFFGFPFQEEDALGDGGDDAGMYFALEERVSETRFAIDVPSTVGGSAVAPTVWEGMPEAPNLTDWADLNWGPIEPDTYLDSRKPKDDLVTAGQPRWDTNSAAVAWITVQRPVRVAVHASRMIPTADSE